MFPAVLIDACQMPGLLLSARLTPSLQMFGAASEQPPGPDGSGSEPDQHRHEERRLRGAAPLAAPQSQVQAAAEGPDPPDGIAHFPAQDVSGFRPRQK